MSSSIFPLTIRIMLPPEVGSQPVVMLDVSRSCMNVALPSSTE